MNIVPMGDYYVWYCEWCDSRNLTSWVKLGHDSICCSACQKRFEICSDRSLLINEGSAGYDNEVPLSGIPRVAIAPSP